MTANPKIILYIACSLNGYIARKDGSIEWLSLVENMGENYGCQEFYDSIDAIIMGRNTYEQVLRFGNWPYKGKPCYAISNNFREDQQTGVIISTEDPATLITTLSLKKYNRVWLVGGADILKTFLSKKIAS